MVCAHYCAPYPNDHVYDMRSTCIVHAVWHHFIPEPSTFFSQVPWLVLWLCHQFVTDVTAWPINTNPSCSKNRKWKRKRKKNKLKRKEKIKMKSTVNNLDITPLLRFLLQRNFSTFPPYDILHLFFFSFHFLSIVFPPPPILFQFI